MQGKVFSVEIRPRLPERFERMEELANDLYFSWNRGIRGFFRHLDERAWHESGHNPKVFLRRISQQRLERAATDPILFAEYRRVLSVYDTYLEERPHTRIDRYLDPERDLVAYFSAEFGFHQSMPIYAGGLGILAADYCKAMSNLWVPFVGVGLLYRQGYFTQLLLAGGEQQAEYPYNEPEDLPVSTTRDAAGNELLIAVELSGHIITLRVWTARAGHIRLYLLDSDHPDNTQDDRAITAQLYGGDSHNRIRQEILLGVGGVRLLRALGLAPSVWHINEGHAAFQILERCREYCRQGLDFEAARERVAADTLFTTHTPVPAGHDSFEPAMVLEQFRSWLPDFRIDEARFLALGQAGQGAGFNMTALALRGSRFHNGVSRIHGEVASRMESYAWPDIPPDENPMGYITNGVDVETFLGGAWVSVFDMYCGSGWRAKLCDRKFWNWLIDYIPDHVFRSAHHVHKAELLAFARENLEVKLRRAGQAESTIAHITRHLDPGSLDVLLIGFARRFATYKRATLVFRDLQRLARLVNAAERPVMFLYAGKAHPNDRPGQELIREIYRISLLPEFQGKVLLLENYNLPMARELVSGVDVWLNLPEYPQEACGTSGMKAAVNGAINLSVLDGWWGEAYDGSNGWAINPHPDLDPQTRDDREAEELLDLLEHQVIPLYYQRDSSGVPSAWIHRSKASMKSILPRFNNIRMAMDYLRIYYRQASRHGARLGAEQAKAARELAAWKRHLAEAWPGVQMSLLAEPPVWVRADEPIPIEVGVDLNGLAPEDLVVECVFGRLDRMGAFQHECIGEEGDCTLRLHTNGKTLEGLTRFHGDLAQADLQTRMSGLVRYQLRVFPQHPLLAHRFETGRMKWLRPGN